MEGGWRNVGQVEKSVFITLSVVALVLGMFPMFFVGWLLGLGMAGLVRRIMRRKS